MTKRSIITLALALLLCLGVGYLGSLVTVKEIPTWYAGLAKPSWTPPPPVFPVVWTTLYILMAISLWLLATSPSSPERRTALIVFFIQLALNAMWSPVFFGLHATRAALVIIVALLIAIVAGIVSSLKVNRVAGWLMLPYLLWIVYASSLNAGVVLMN